MEKLLQDQTSNDLLTTREVANLLKVHVTSVRRWSKTGVLKSYRIGLRGHRKYLKRDILNCLCKISPGGEICEY